MQELRDIDHSGLGMSGPSGGLFPRPLQHHQHNSLHPLPLLPRARHPPQSRALSPRKYPPAPTPPSSTSTPLATGPFLVIVDQTVSRASDLLVTSARAAQPPRPPTPTGIKAFLGFPPPTVTAPAARVSFTAALDVVADMVGTQAIRSARWSAAIGKVAELQRVLEERPWVSTRVVTDEQWRRREEEMWKWLLEVREGVRKLWDYGWWELDWENYEKLDKRVKVSYVQEDK